MAVREGLEKCFEVENFNKPIVSVAVQSKKLG